MRSAITISLVPEAAGGPFVFSNGLADGFAQAAKLGFDAVELFPPSADSLSVPEVKRLCESHRLRVAAVGTGAGWLKHRLRVTDPDLAVRRRAREFIASLVDLAAGFRAPAILGSMQGKWGDGVSRDQALEWLAEALEEFASRAESHDMPLLYEPLNRYETNLFNCISDSLEFLEKLRTKNVKLLGDLFHMNIEEPDIPAALRLAGSRLGHVHFADSNRRAVGLGHTSMGPIIEALRALGYDGYLSAEIFPLPNSEQAAAQTIASFRQLTGQ